MPCVPKNSAAETAFPRAEHCDTDMRVPRLVRNQERLPVKHLFPRKTLTLPPNTVWMPELLTVEEFVVVHQQDCSD